MKKVKLTIENITVGNRTHARGDVVALPDSRAADLIRMGHAEPTDGGEIENPDHNPLADAIEPAPPGGAVLTPVDALAPNVLDNPGLTSLAELASTKRRGNRVRPDSAGPSGTAPRDPEEIPRETTTADLGTDPEGSKPAPTDLQPAKPRKPKTDAPASTVLPGPGPAPTGPASVPAGSPVSAVDPGSGAPPASPPAPGK